MTHDFASPQAAASAAPDASLDRLDLSASALVAWFKAPRTPTMSPEEVDHRLHALHPRVQFVKSLRPRARLVDFGAGDGGLVTFRAWPDPPRPDLTMFAYSLEPSPGFARYDGVEIARFEEAPPKFDGKPFDAVMASHVIEHLSDPAAFVAWAAHALAPGGRLYIEWPSPVTLRLPKRDALLREGMDVMISNFFDDDTHLAIPDRRWLEDTLAGAGFAIDQSGYVRSPFFEEELLAHDQVKPNAYYRLTAYWSRTYWAQLVVATRL